ncbi:MAG TPA: thiolase domain-containing protein, partial [Candidatus Bathyarchaeota archaeon]|nr:thiolase domain-containing protein [Candidatus Bathyarchaeota archaeon]
YAQFPFPITVERVLESPPVADPIRLFDTTAPADGAAALVLCPLETAKKLCDTPVVIEASVLATDGVNPYERDDVLTLTSTRVAAERAYRTAGISPRDVDVVEVHNTSSIMGVLALEDLGFVEKGQGWRFVAEGQIALNADLPTNTLGGLKARGHPWGATGVYQLVELTWQLRGEAGGNQVDGAEIGLAQSVGGLGATTVVHILRRWH